MAGALALSVTYRAEGIALKSIEIHVRSGPTLRGTLSVWKQRERALTKRPFITPWE